MFALVICVSIICTANSAAGYPQISNQPTAENTDYGTIEVAVSFGKNNPIIGGTPEYYILQYRKEGEPWIDFAKDVMPDDEVLHAGYTRNFTISGLESGVVYNVRVVLVQKGSTYVPDDESIPYYIVPTKCYIPEEYDYQVRFSELAGLLSISWSYTNASKQWCPVLGYQVNWTRNNKTWLTQEVTYNEGFMIYTGIKVTVRVRSITTGGYTPFSKNMTYPAEKVSVPHAPKTLELMEKTATSALIRWTYQKSNGTAPINFLVNITEVEAGIPGECCQQFPIIKVSNAEELPYYELEIGGLLPAATYMVGVSVPGSKEIEGMFTTPPPALPFFSLPDVKINTLDTWSWLPQQPTDTVDRPDLYKHLITSRVILVIPEDSSWVKETFISYEIKNQLQRIINKPFFVASEYSEGTTVTLEDGRSGSSDLGRYNNMDLPDGAKYQLAAVQLAEYDNSYRQTSYNIDVMFSTTFQAAP